MFHYGEGRITAAWRSYTSSNKGRPAGGAGGTGGAGAGGGGASGGVAGGAGAGGAGDEFTMETYSVDPFMQPPRAGEQARQAYIYIIL